MAKLSELDPFYQTAISTLPANERLAYCQQRLDKLQHLLDRNAQVLHNEQKRLIMDMIQALQEEITRTVL